VFLFAAQYVDHLRQNPQSLLSRIFGLHRVVVADTTGDSLSSFMDDGDSCLAAPVRPRRSVPWAVARGNSSLKKKLEVAARPGNVSAYFVVVGTIFDSHLGLHETFDLKGSLAGRSAGVNDRVKKDTDWVAINRRMCLSAEDAKRLETIHERDCLFLNECNHFDYSLLIGIHDRAKSRMGITGVVGGGVKLLGSTVRAIQWAAKLRRKAAETRAAGASARSENSTCKDFSGNRKGSRCSSALDAHGDIAADKQCASTESEIASDSINKGGDFDGDAHSDCFESGENDYAYEREYGLASRKLASNRDGSLLRVEEVFQGRPRDSFTQTSPTYLDEDRPVEAHHVSQGIPPPLNAQFSASQVEHAETIKRPREVNPTDMLKSANMNERPCPYSGFGCCLESANGNEVYLVGLIDFVTPYSSSRYFHTAWKWAKSGGPMSQAISPVPSGRYAVRQRRFFREYVISSPAT